MEKDKETRGEGRAIQRKLKRQSEQVLMTGTWLHMLNLVASDDVSMNTERPGRAPAF